MSRFRLKIWGVRGSIPVPGPYTVRYGGNTSCLELFTAGDERIIFDAGSGLRNLGLSLDLSKPHRISLFISHPHWDHINGLPFFPALFIPGNDITIYGPRTHELSLEDILNGQMQYTYFPIRMAELRANIKYVELVDGQTFNLGGVTISTRKLNHPVNCLGYRVEQEGRIFVYLADNEPYYNIYKDSDPDVESVIQGMNRAVIDFVRGSDLLVADSQYIPSEYEAKRGWGHSTTHHVVNLALKGTVKKVLFFHHEPLRNDDDMDKIISHYRQRMKAKGLSLMIDGAREGEIIEI
ncbi:MAG: MBL fold metallo-hydrolase [Spirochaetae bacterium HGW-Spirochaetae-1]|jgi:phosphoribosyl 1,2-cyclic phosphodiesterase|nr:MAG: MBL fold metallo-hydrolase [Spirochaetae bacterium HGW-Spirochaetae-1]